MLRLIIRMAIMGAVALAGLVIVSEVKRRHGMHGLSMGGFWEAYKAAIFAVPNDPRAPVAVGAVLLVALRGMPIAGIFSGFFGKLALLILAACVFSGFLGWLGADKPPVTWAFVLGCDFSGAYSGLMFGIPFFDHWGDGFSAGNAQHRVYVQLACAAISVAFWFGAAHWLSKPSLSKTLANKFTWGLGMWLSCLLIGFAAAVFGQLLVLSWPHAAPSSIMRLITDTKSLVTGKL